VKLGNLKGKHTILILVGILAAVSMVPVRAEEEYGLIATLEPTIPGGGAYFGTDIALSEDLLLISEYKGHVEDVGPAGKAYLYDADWNLLSTLQAPEPRTPADFGWSAAALGDLIVVGCPMVEVEGIRRAGEAYVFDSDGSLLSTLRSPDPKSSGEFGIGVALGKDVILVGEIGGRVQGFLFAGAVHVYDTEGVYITTLTSPSMKNSGMFGNELAANEEFILVGEPGWHGEPPFVVGSVHVFDYDWNLVTTIQAPEQAIRTLFGLNIAIEGETVVIGEIIADVEGVENAGRAYIYDTGWNLLATLQSPAPRVSGEFGWGTAIGGDLIVVGERRGDVDSIKEGKAYVYDLEGNLLSTLVSPEPSIGAEFGYKTATDGEIVVVAETSATVGDVTQAGKVHIFQAGAAAFTSSGLNIDPSSADVGGTVTISVEVTNTGAKSGTHTVALKIDEEVKDEKTVTVNPDETETVSFEVSASELGTFSVEVDGLSGSYTVTEPEEPSFWERIPGFQYESIVLGLAAGILVIWLLQRKR
jgi:hypothetical protein